MNRFSKMVRIFLGILLAPLLYIIVWTLPLLEHTAFSKWIVINTFFAYLVFLILAGISHLVLKRFNATKVWSYILVMFVVAVCSDLILSIWSLSGFQSYYYAQTQVVENGSITAAGYVLQIEEALINGFVSSGVMALFWLVAVFNPKGNIAHA